MSLFKNHRAFTLIEMIIVISILGLMLAVIVPTYRSYNRRNELREAAQTVRSALVEAQNAALAPKHAGKEGWQYGAEHKDASTFVVYEQNPNISESYKELRIYKLPDSIEWVTTGWDVDFTPHLAKASCPATLTITLKIKDSSDAINVVLNCASGQVNIQ
jgi:prepilin-type N-terminal cleavage/methylation domain-containing protein